MFSSASYSAFIGLAVVTTLLFIVAYCVRLNHIHRHIAPLPMQVVVLAQPHHHQLDYPQICWSIPIEQPPPPYTAVVTPMNTNRNNVHSSNVS
ncbi:unnamed protein product [Rotaria sp. Silwood2]|nr:unnamed protein product [Rotaria sp. Silwood2]CAF2516236.1 unnamed protein product [Rotaria sp. Silwood2]CAF2910634.1 unnamed protein product [Rotaria sp. Silwood2]CAF3854290.1 unnamed protein product [Rotaria sp. Silwood2]CAF3876354.1 unnamed protein product [Rotaria sp. Silwood2]